MKSLATTFACTRKHTICAAFAGMFALAGAFQLAGTGNSLTVDQGKLPAIGETNHHLDKSGGLPEKFGNPVLDKELLLGVTDF